MAVIMDCPLCWLDPENKFTHLCEQCKFLGRETVKEPNKTILHISCRKYHKDKWVEKKERKK